MATVSITEIVKSIRDLPSLPAVVMELMSCIDQEDSGANLLGEKISRDQALAAKTLRLANSSFYGMQRKISTIPQAIAVLGLNSVRTLVAAVAVSNAFPGSSAGRFDFSMFWRHSIATALCAKALARHMRIDSDQAFIAGLLHDIGRLILVVRFPQEYDAVLDYSATNKCQLLQAERALLEVEHTQVGRALAEHWKFPMSIQDAIGLHHEPDLKKAGPLATAVQVANHVTYAMMRTDAEERVAPQLSQAELEGLGISEAVYRVVFEETMRQFDEVSRILVDQSEVEKPQNDLGGHRV